MQARSRSRPGSEAHAGLLEQARAVEGAFNQLVAEQRDDSVLEEEGARIAVPVDARRAAAVIGSAFGAGAQRAELAQSQRVAAQEEHGRRALKQVLEAANSGLNYVVKTTVFLRDMGDFPKMNAIYAEFFPENPPARSTVAVKTLPKDVALEIEAVALVAPAG